MSHSTVDGEGPDDDSEGRPPGLGSTRRRPRFTTRCCRTEPSSSGSRTAASAIWRSSRGTLATFRSTRWMHSTPSRRVLGLDTNVLRQAARRGRCGADAPRPRALVERAVEREEPVLVSLPVIIETEWVLRSRYDLRQDQAILASLSGLMAARELTFEDEPAIEGGFVSMEGQRGRLRGLPDRAHNRASVAARADGDLRCRRRRESRGSSPRSLGAPRRRAAAARRGSSC